MDKIIIDQVQACTSSSVLSINLMTLMLHEINRMGLLHISTTRVEAQRVELGPLSRSIAQMSIHKWDGALSFLNITIIQLIIVCIICHFAQLKKDSSRIIIIILFIQVYSILDPQNIPKTEQAFACFIQNFQAGHPCQLHLLIFYDNVWFAEN